MSTGAVATAAWGFAPPLRVTDSNQDGGAVEVDVTCTSVIFHRTHADKGLLEPKIFLSPK